MADYNEWLQSSPPIPVASPPESILFPPFRTENVDQQIDQSLSGSERSDQRSPVFLHLQGCECNGCNRLSPIDKSDATTLSFPVDMQTVAKRLSALKEMWLLEVDVDAVHREADIETV